MTENATYRDQGRAVLLAAIMILSMVAASATLVGAAAAQQEELNVQFDETVVQGEQTTITAEFAGAELTRITGDTAGFTVTGMNPEPNIIGNPTSFPTELEDGDDIFYGEDTHDQLEITADATVDPGTYVFTAEVEDAEGNVLDTEEFSIEITQEQQRSASVTINDQTGTSPVDEVNVASANASEEFVVVVHEGASTPDGEVGNIIGTSGPFTGEQTDVSVTLDRDRAPLTQSQQIFAMIHEANDDGSAGAPINEVDGFVDSAQLTVEESASFSVSELDPADAQVDVGQEFAVSATITNNGDSSGTQEVELRLEPGGDAVATQSITLDAGASQTVTFEGVSVPQTGEFDHTIATANDSASGDLTVESQTAPGAVEPTDVSVLFQGEEVSVDVSDEATDGDILQIVEGVIGTDDTERVASVQAEEDADGNLVATFQQANTEDLTTDSFHFFRIGSQDIDGTQFEVLGQELDVSFDSNVTTQSTVGTLSVASDNYADNVDADSFRSDTFTLEVNSNGLDNEELADVFDVSEDSAVDDPEADDPVQVAGVAPGDDLSPDFDGIAEGDYEFDVSVVETTASDDAVVAVEPPRDEEAALGENTVQENVGDIADIPVELVDTDTATVDISIEGYSAEIEVTDGDDDGDVTLQYNTALAGNNNGDAVVSTANSDDSATLVDEEAIDQRIPQDSYTVEVRLGNARQDRGQLVLTERSTDLVQVHVAPESVPGPTEGDDGTEFLEEAGTNVLGEIGLSTVAEGDTVAVLIGASGIEGDHEDFTGEAGISLELVEQNTDQFEDAAVLNASTNPAVFGDVAEREAIDGTEDQYLVEIDTSALASADNGGLQAYDVEFTVSEDSPYVEESDQGEDSNAEQVTSELEVDEPSVSLIDPDDDDTYTLTNTGNVSISGGSNLAPGTELTVSVVGDASFQSTSATTGANGDFEATFDLSGVDSDQGVDVEVDSALTGDTFDAEFGDTQETDLVADADRIPDLEATISDLEGQLADREATISDLEGQLADREATISDLESQLEEADSTISDLESQLEERDSTISDLESQLEERNSTISDLESEVSDLESQLEDAQSDSGGDSDGGGPGFGIAAALVALIGAALLAVRRRD